MKKPLPFDIGGLTHEGLKIIHHPLYRSKPMIDRLEMAIRQVKAKSAEGVAEHEDEFDLEEVLRLLRGYVAEYPKDPGHVLTVEQEISFPMEEGIFYRGTVDMLAQDDHNQLIMWEHKTSRSLSASIIQMYGHSPQTLGYAYCLKETLSQDVALIMINLLIKTKKPTFHREPVMVQKIYLEQWREWALKKGREIKTCLDTDTWSENRYSCYPWVGKPCVYIPLCWYGETDASLAFFKTEDGPGPSGDLVGDAD
jgi:hypothetical protein